MLSCCHAAAVNVKTALEELVSAFLDFLARLTISPPLYSLYAKLG